MSTGLPHYFDSVDLFFQIIVLQEQNKKYLKQKNFLSRRLL